MLNSATHTVYTEYNKLCYSPYYPRYDSYALTGSVCLSVCLFLCLHFHVKSTDRIFTKVLPVASPGVGMRAPRVTQFRGWHPNKNIFCGWI